MNKTPNSWLVEYESFLNAEEQAVPGKTTEKVMSRMSTLLKPNAWMVFLKILGIHTVVGSLSLSVCHQFGMNPFGTENSLDGWFMDMWGHHTCMVVCGLLFVSLSFLSAGYFLTIEEVKALKRTEFIQALSLGGVSLALFVVLGAEIAFVIALLWLVGALAGGFLATEAVWKMKRLSL